MDFLIQTAWYSIELHGHALAFHGTPSVLQRTPWNSMELYNIPWNSMDLKGNSMEFHGIPWNSINTSWNSVELLYSMEPNGYSTELHGIPWNSMDTPWNSKAFHRTSSMEFHRFLSISMEFHSMEVFHTGTGCKLFAGVSPFKYGNYVLTIMCYAIMQPSHKRPV